jgi:MoaA/NifB/PqqE/SkfB family radical SAM enzyme
MTFGRPDPVRDENRRRALEDYEQGRTVLQSRPRVLFVELTRACNLACPMCREPGSVPRHQRLSESHFSRIASELFPTAELVDLRGWGESLILPEFPQRLETAVSHGCDIRIVTNLSFRRDEVLAQLAAVGAMIGISIDSADAETLALLRQGAQLGRIERNLRLLGEAYAAAGRSDRLSFYVTVQRPALPSLEKLVELAARYGIPQIRLSPVTLQPGHPFDLAPVRDQTLDALDRMRAAASRHGIEVSLLASMVDGWIERDHASPCLHPWAYAYFAWDGSVGFCDHLIGPAGEPFLVGHLDRQPFEEIWNGPGWTALRHEHLGERRADAPLFHECAWCYRNRHADFEHLLVPRCARTRVLLNGLNGLLPVRPQAADAGSALEDRP